MPKNKAQLIIALDVDTFEEARATIDLLKNDVEIFKVGSQLFTACGPVVVRYIQAQGKKVFLDLKYHDIPNTVASAVRSAVGLSVPGHDAKDATNAKPANYQPLFMCTVHTIGAEEMLKAAAKSAKDQAAALKVAKPLIVGITVLTSDARTDNIAAIVLERARLAKRCGLDGVVASVEEASAIRRECGEGFVIVTPGIRPSGASKDDQKRVATASEAIKQGSNFLVVGRPIIQAPDPAQAAKAILKEIA